MGGIDMLRSLVVAVALLVAALPAHAEPAVVHVRTPVSPPAWALLEREVLRATGAACE
jgi:hypothetical protein